jgi:hypothetical protein
MLIPFTWKGADEDAGADVGVGVGVEVLAVAGGVFAELGAADGEGVGEGLVVPISVLVQPTSVSMRSKLIKEKHAREKTRC